LIWCNGTTEGGFIKYAFEVTPSGKFYGTSESIGAFGFIAIILLMTILFGGLAFGFAKTENFKPASLFFFGLMILFIIYSLYIGYAFTRDIAILEATTTSALTIFTTTLWLFIGLIVAGMAFLLLYTLKQWKLKRMKENQEDGWDGGIIK